MEPTSGEKRRVLYHAVSSYQLLEAVLHRLRFHPGDPAVLLLPDFIAEKYPKYRRLAERGFFQEVRLFPYLRVPHRSEEEVFAEAARACRKALPCPLTDFSRVYVAGAHFYFTLCLIQAGIPFTFFEDAAGMLTRAGELEENLARRYPLHAAIAAKYGLFDGSCPLAREIVCLKSAQRGPLPPHCADFSVELALEEQRTENQIEETMAARVNVLQTVSQVLSKELGREATLEELSAKMKMSEDEVRDIMKLALDALTVNGEGQAAASGQDEEESPNPVRNGWNLEEGL